MGLWGLHPYDTGFAAMENSIVTDLWWLLPRLQRKAWEAGNG